MFIFVRVQQNQVIINGPRYQQNKLWYLGFLHSRVSVHIFVPCTCRCMVHAGYKAVLIGHSVLKLLSCAQTKACDYIGAHQA